MVCGQQELCSFNHQFIRRVETRTTEFKRNIDLLNEGVLSSLVLVKKHTSIVFVKLISSVLREGLSQSRLGILFHPQFSFYNSDFSLSKEHIREHR